MHKKNVALKFALFVSGLLIFSASNESLADTPKNTPTALPQTGDLGGSFKSGGGQSRQFPWGGVALEGGEEKAPPVGASVSRAGRDKFLLKVFNNSEDFYSVDVSVEQLSKTGDRVKKDSYSFSLKGKESDEREVTASALADSAVARMAGWKKKVTVTPTAAATPQATPAEKRPVDE